MGKFPRSDEQPPRPKVTPELLSALRGILRELLESSGAPWVLDRNGLRERLKAQGIHAGGQDLEAALNDLSISGLLKFSRGEHLGSWELQWISPQI
jgi:hypothetical protein